MSAVFLDTNVFLYAAGEEHPHRESCRRVLERVAGGELQATTSAEVVQEILHFLCRRGRHQDGVRLARSVLTLVPDMLPVEGEDLARATEILEDVPGTTARDALHAAVVGRRGLDGIVSVDVHFDALPGIRRWDPGDIG